MFLQRLTIMNYRNITECNIAFSPKINCFLGRNGMGKTNLLDAIYYLSFCRSSINPIDIQNINYGQDVFMIQGNYLRNDTQEQIACSVKQRRKKQFTRNKKEYERLADHIGLIPLVLSSPMDTELIDGGSDQRRRFVDMAVAQYDRNYLNALMRYNHALQSRNALLKADSPLDSAVLDVLEEQMSACAKLIFDRRKAFIAEFTPVFQQYYMHIAEEQETVDLHYISHNEQGELAQLLREVRDRDRIIGYTSRGIHKDDLEMMLDNYPIKRRGSQGQNKTFLIALRMAQFFFLASACEQTPILLFDDLFDKLDALRVQRIIDIVASDKFGQIFITDTNRNHLDNILRSVTSDTRIFEVEQGSVL
ncbi:MAG: DNA replication and repair protein RecF [Prevotellaceae bacterium]|jgi:DNA replication and repair protein RecF|nr:DNA replication and repair protein RecF [Prevotellaceae bacterium]